MLIFWDKLNGKIKTHYYHKQYFFELLEFCTGIFEWTLPEGLDGKYIERYLNSSGCCALTRNVVGEYRLSLGGLEPPLDQYGIGTTWHGETLGGESCAGIVGESAAVCWHNSDHTPNLDIVPAADRLTEFDKSIWAATRSARAMPVSVAHDEKTLNAFKDMTQQITDGEIVAILSENAMDDFQNVKAFEQIEFTKPEYNRLLQYLFEAKENEYRIFYRKYGQNMQTSAKHAQVNEDELNGADSVAFIVPRDMLEQRQRFCAEASRIFRDTFSVKFAEPWASEEIRYDADTEQQLAEAEQAAAEAEQAADAADQSKEVQEDGSIEQSDS